MHALGVTHLKVAKVAKGEEGIGKPKIHKYFMLHRGQSSIFQAAIPCCSD